MVEVIILIAALAGVAGWLHWHDTKNDKILEELKKDSEEHKDAHARLIKMLSCSCCCNCDCCDDCCCKKDCCK